MAWAVVISIGIVASVSLLAKRGGNLRIYYRGFGQHITAEYRDTEKGDE